MVVEVIYVVRHGFRSNWVVDADTGTYWSPHPTPTGIASDPALAAYGTQQAKQLADKLISVDPPIDIVYSSPFYRCLQTLKPTIEKLNDERPKKHGGGWEVRVENGISEFFGTARFNHPAPAQLGELSSHFPWLHQTYKVSIFPNPNGETLPALHDRYAYALHRIIAETDGDPTQPKAILLCTHAAGLICIGRALTGNMPDNVDAEDFRCGTCAFSKFERRKGNENHTAEQEVKMFERNRPDRIPAVPWRGGAGIQGGWDCTVNGDCSFLDAGEERTWSFSMEQQHPGNHPQPLVSQDTAQDTTTAVIASSTEEEHDSDTPANILTPEKVTEPATNMMPITGPDAAALSEGKEPSHNP